MFGHLLELDARIFSVTSVLSAQAVSPLQTLFESMTAEIQRLQIWNEYLSESTGQPLVAATHWQKEAKSSAVWSRAVGWHWETPSRELLSSADEEVRAAFGRFAELVNDPPEFCSPDLPLWQTSKDLSNTLTPILEVAKSEFQQLINNEQESFPRLTQEWYDDLIRVMESMTTSTLENRTPRTSEPEPETDSPLRMIQTLSSGASSPRAQEKKAVIVQKHNTI